MPRVAGVRGGISIALALSLPPYTDAAYLFWRVLIFVVMFSIIICLGQR